jgi:hypothetical protein
MRPTPTGEQVLVQTHSGAVRGFWRTHSAAFLGTPGRSDQQGHRAGRCRTAQSRDAHQDRTRGPDTAAPAGRGGHDPAVAARTYDHPDQAGLAAAGATLFRDAK